MFQVIVVSISLGFDCLAAFINFKPYCFHAVANIFDIAVSYCFSDYCDILSLMWMFTKLALILSCRLVVLMFFIVTMPMERTMRTSSDGVIGCLMGEIYC